MNNRNLSLWFLIVLVLLLCCLFPIEALSQTLTTGDIVGTVYDPTKAVIPNISVSLRNLDTEVRQTTVANGVGFYTFKLLNPGRYEVITKETGFAEVKLPVTVSLGQTTTADLTLPISQTAETIEVSGVGPVVTQAASVNTSFGQIEVKELPSAGGDITNIAQTSPGAVANVVGGYGNFTVNGMPATSNLFTVNGENNMDPYFNINNSGATNLTLGNNEIDEATVITNPYGGEYGQLAGAQVTYITRSGTNHFHGNAQYWWNGRAANASGWMNKNSQILGGLSNQTPFSNANQWAASFGRPLRKSRTFFFVNTEGMRFVLPNSLPVIVPTQTFADAVLANIQNVQPNEYSAYKTMFGLLRNAKGASRAIPLSLSSPSNPGGCGDLAPGAIPGFNPSTTPCGAQFTATPTALSTQWILSARVDHNLSDNDKMFFRYRMDRGLQASVLDPISSNFNVTSNQPSYDGQFQETHIFGLHLTNSFIAALSHYRAVFQQDAAKVAQTFPYGVISTGTVQFGYDLGGVFGFNQQYGYPQGRNFTQYQFIDDVSWSRGNHNFKFGANFHRYDVSDHTFFYVNPAVYFGYTGSGMTEFANGLAYQYRQADNIANNVPIAMWYLGAYGQDEWNVKPNLKLTFALRFERNSNPVCQINCMANFTSTWNNLPSVQAGVNAENIPYTQDIGYNLHQAYPGVDGIDLSPRFGFSWSPGSDPKTVISGGFGIFYDTPPSGLVGNLLGNPPVSTMFRVRPTGGTPAFDPGPTGSAAIYEQSPLHFALVLLPARPTHKSRET